MLPKSALITFHLAEELSRLLKGAEIDTITYEKTTKEFCFNLLGKHGYQILYSFAPPTFVLLSDSRSRDSAFEIWREVAGAVVTNVAGHEDNRIIRIYLSAGDKAGEQRSLEIVFELFGAQTNALLLNESGQILHALRTVTDQRMLRPGLKYEEPQALQRRVPADKIPLANYAGVKYSLLTESEHYSIHGDPQIPFEMSKKFPLISFYENIYRLADSRREYDQRQKHLLTEIQQELKKAKQTLARYQKDLKECENEENYRRFGDLLMANPQAVKADGSVRLRDFYTDDLIEVPLPPGKGIFESAGHYYKLAKRLQRAPVVLKPRIEKLLQTIKRLQDQLEQTRSASNIAELDITITLGRKKLDQEKARTAEKSPHARSYRAFRSNAGERILVGKSAADNDILTFKVARSYDLWFHVQQSSGSHVVLVLSDKNKPASKKSIQEAAQIAAYFSGMKKSDHVPVVFTERRHVRKAKGATPGKVLVQQSKTIFVDPFLPKTNPDDDIDINS